MGLLSRLKNISTGKLISFLDEAERPEEMIPQLLSELNTQHKALQNAEAKSLAAVRAAQRRLEETMGRALRLQRGAELAIKKGEDKTAKEALREQLKVEQDVPQQRKQVEQAQQILDEVRERTSSINEQINLIQQKEDQLKAIPAQHPTLKTEPILNKIAQMEERVLSEEIDAEVQQSITKETRRRSLDERLLELEKNDEIENRLRKIRKG